MATNERNKPDEVKNVPAQEATAEEKKTPAPIPEIGVETPAPEKTAEADKRNAFDTSKLINRRMKKLNPNEQYNVYNVEATE